MRVDCRRQVKATALVYGKAKRFFDCKKESRKVQRIHLSRSDLIMIGVEGNPFMCPRCRATLVTQPRQDREFWNLGIELAAAGSYLSSFRSS
jgi:hypothetical protein